ncbi:MAG: PLP-dependent transferase [Gemmatimonadales bacterium]
MRLETLATHAGRDDLRELGLHAPPIDLSTTYPVRDLDDAVDSLSTLAEGAPRAAESVYSRLHSPTVRRFELALAALEGADDAVAFASGMAAVTAALLAAGQAGRHVVAIRPIYGTTDHLLTSGLLGGRVTWAGAAEVADAIRPDTGLVLLETPANPTLDLVDIADVVRQAGRVPVAVDSTFATPILQQPLRHGAALAIHSATKFLGGHGDVLAGVVACSDEWAARLRQVRVATGAVLHPLAGYLLHRGLATLPVRVERAQRTAQALARRLAGHEAVARVAYPGLPGVPGERLLGEQMAGPGTMIAFEVAGGRASAERLLASLDLITHAVSLGSTDSLIQCPAALTHHLVDDESRSKSGVSEGLLRLSVGLEHVDDLWDDLLRGLAAASDESADSAWQGRPAIGARARERAVR